jgi:hypothetical protein
MNLIQQKTHPLVFASLVAGGSREVRQYATVDGLAVIASVDPTPHGDLRHVSISRCDRYPSWDEIRAVREALVPMDVDVMMMLPRKADYVNVHPNCFHLWQTPKDWRVQ